MAKYKVLESFELEAAVEASEGVEAKDAVMAEVGAEVELSDERAAELEGKVEKVESAE